MRLIDADALKQTIGSYNPIKYTYEYGSVITVADIDTAPTIEAEPVKRGEWIYDNQFHWYRASCSACGYMRSTDIKADNWNGWNYCPNCGARMERSDETD